MEPMGNLFRDFMINMNIICFFGIVQLRINKFCPKLIYLCTLPSFMTISFCSMVMQNLLMCFLACLINQTNVD
jgi:hypothetical protein